MLKGVHILLHPPTGGHLIPEAWWLLRSEHPVDSLWGLSWDLDVLPRAAYWYF